MLVIVLKRVFFKLMNNSVYDKSTESIRKIINLIVVIMI